MTAYRVLETRILTQSNFETDEDKECVMAEKGDIVYKCVKYDYGLARDDTFYTRMEHISVTKNSDGDYPSFTIPLKDLEKVNS